MNKVLIGVLVIVGILGVGVGGYMYLNSKGKSQKAKVMEEKIVVEPTGVMEEKKEEVMMEGFVKEFTVEGSSFKFAPAEIKVKKGDAVRLTFKNTKGTHDWVIDEYEVATSQIGEGEEEEVEFVADKTGIYEYYCSVGNHRALGMVGKLIVE
jgi:plastocyanin